MTRDDFEAITALPEYRTIGVSIELRYLGFMIIASAQDRNGRLITAERPISYAHAFELAFPVDLFRREIAEAIRVRDLRLLHGF